MPVTDELLRKLRCPETKQRLAPADAETLERIRSASGDTVDDGLVREDGKRAYPIRNGFPILLLDAAIDLSGPPPPHDHA